MKSVKLPGISDTAVSTVSEILAFTTLPYYQVTGILKSGEGSLAVGDLVAYDSSSKKFLKYAPGKTDVTVRIRFMWTTLKKQKALTMC